jgi:prolipoprotein diacylglyceryltransferase
MHQVLFRIPIIGLPVFGYGAMMCLAFLSCLFVASWRAKKEGIDPNHMWDTAYWIIGFGLIGARITFMVQYQMPITKFFFIWEGGLVFYGCLIGGAVGYIGAYFHVIRKHRISTWKIADIVACCIPLGLAFGRIGCFLNGCCYGNVACTSCPAVHFPLSSLARNTLVDRGLQTAAGFALKSPTYLLPVTVSRVEPGSAAANAGLQDGDVILEANGKKMNTIHAWFKNSGDANGSDRIYEEYDGNESYQLGVDKLGKAGYWATQILDPLSYYLTRDWPAGQTALQLKVRHANGKVEELPTFYPVTLGLHPTQLYETISMIFLFLLLGAFYPFRPRLGSVMALFMVCYAVHRFLNEMLRKDTDPVAFGLTLSQNGSILLFLGGVVLWVILWLTPSLKPSAAVAVEPRT